MKTLVATTLWVPDRAEFRLRLVTRHLEHLGLYTGDWDLHIVDNCGILADEVSAVTRAAEDCGRLVTLNCRYDNPGWCTARNLALTRFWEGNYDQIILMDCDSWCTDLSWIELAQGASKLLPAYTLIFPGSYIQGTCYIGEFRFEVVRDWYGNVNVLTRDAVATVGGYDGVTYPWAWGFHDLDYGVRLKKAGMLSKAGNRYLSLCAGCSDEHDEEYTQKLATIKGEISRKSFVFFDRVRKIERGEAPVFVDYRVLP
jgi:hypothetical protein